MTDAERLEWIMKNSGIDGIAGVAEDRHEYASTAAYTAGRSEPNAEDELNGFRWMIDDAAISAA